MAAWPPLTVEMSHSLVKAPMEAATASFRTKQKLLEKELAAVVTGLKNLKKKPGGQAEAAAQVDALVARLKKLKKKLAEASAFEERQLRNCRTRLAGLRDVEEAEKGDDRHVRARVRRRWNEAETDRLVSDHMLREGFTETAEMLASEAGIEDLVDLELHQRLRALLESLIQRDCGPALSWAAENRHRLKKMDSTLELKLRIQEFLGYVSKGKQQTAVKYARRYLAPLMDTPEGAARVQEAVTTLAFKSDGLCSKYRPLFEETRWDELAADLRRDFLRLHAMPLTSPLSSTLQAGLASMKLPACFEGRVNTNCPVCVGPLHEVAKDLPYALHTHSVLVCRISGELMDEANPPMVLPNGYVYGRSALERMAARNDGAIVCPLTGDKCTIEDVQKVYFL